MTFDRLGRFAVRRRWWIVAAWAALILVAIPFAPRAPGALSAGGFILDDLESARAKQVLQDGAGRGALGVRARVHLGHAAGGDARVARRGSGGDPGRGGGPARDADPCPTSWHRRQVSADGTTAYDIVFLDLPPDDSPAAIPPVQAALHDVPGLTVRIGGGPAFYGDVQAVTETDLRRSELISLPLAALALLLVFGSLVAAGVPLAVGGTAVLVALAGIFLVASVTPMSIFVLNLATLLGLGLGVDYSLLMTSRFREELAHRDGPDRVAEAVRVTVATAGRAVFFSGLTVLLGLLGLVLFEFMILRSVGIAGAIVVALAGRLRAHAAARDAGHRRHPDRRPRDPARGRGARCGRPLGAPRAASDAPPGGRAGADAGAAARAGRPVPARPVQRPGRDDPAVRRCRRARRTTSSPGSSARGSSPRS